MAKQPVLGVIDNGTATVGLGSPTRQADMAVEGERTLRRNLLGIHGGAPC